MAKPKVDTFLDLLRRSGLVEQDQLDDVLLELKQQAEGVRVLRRLLEKYPRSDQAPMARARLRRLGAIASR